MKPRRRAVKKKKESIYRAERASFALRGVRTNALVPIRSDDADAAHPSTTTLPAPTNYKNRC